MSNDIITIYQQIKEYYDTMEILLSMDSKKSSRTACDSPLATNDNYNLIDLLYHEKFIKGTFTVPAIYPEFFSKQVNDVISYYKDTLTLHIATDGVLPYIKIIIDWINPYNLYIKLLTETLDIPINCFDDTIPNLLYYNNKRIPTFLLGIKTYNTIFAYNNMRCDLLPFKYSSRYKMYINMNAKHILMDTLNEMHAIFMYIHYKRWGPVMSINYLGNLKLGSRAPIQAKYK